MSRDRPQSIVHSSRLAVRGIHRRVTLILRTRAPPSPPLTYYWTGTFVAVDLTRRDFLGLTAGVAAAATGLAAARTVEEHHRAIVIGSGYGGAIAAYRLAEAGVRSVVLERGRRWPITPAGDTFPPFLSPDRRSSWFTPTPVYPGMPPAVYRPYAGLFEKIVGQGMNVITGAGVGGLSLVDGVMLQPAEAVFNRVMPAEVDYQEMNDRYYPRVRSRIGGRRHPGRRTGPPAVRRHPALPRPGAPGRPAGGPDRRGVRLVRGPGRAGRERGAVGVDR